MSLKRKEEKLHVYIHMILFLVFKLVDSKSYRLFKVNDKSTNMKDRVGLHLL